MFDITLHTTYGLFIRISTLWWWVKFSVWLIKFVWNKCAFVWLINKLGHAIRGTLVYTAKVVERTTMHHKLGHAIRGTLYNKICGLGWIPSFQTGMMLPNFYFYSFHNFMQICFELKQKLTDDRITSSKKKTTFTIRSGIKLVKENIEVSHSPLTFSVPTNQQKTPKDSNSNTWSVIWRFNVIQMLVQACSDANY